MFSLFISTFSVLFPMTLIQQSSVWSLNAEFQTGVPATRTEDWKGCLLGCSSLGCCLSNQLCRFIKLYRSSVLHDAIQPRPCNLLQQYLTNIRLKIKQKIHNHVVPLKGKTEKNKTGTSYYNVFWERLWVTLVSLNQLIIT